MADIALCRCFHHPAREAAGRCPSCGRFFCRECITEHEGRLVCAMCLAKRIGSPSTKERSLAWLAVAGRAAAGVLIAWLFFYLVGKLLLLVPSSFHEGTFWKG